MTITQAASLSESPYLSIPGKGQCEGPAACVIASLTKTLGKQQLRIWDTEIPVLVESQVMPPAVTHHHLVICLFKLATTWQDAAIS